MGLVTRDLNEAYLHRRTGSRKTKSATAEHNAVATPDMDSQDERLWECAIANSMDAIRDLADKALADRRAGRTKKITL